ncbi:MAG: hypothetical protein UW09_C0003G0087 [candidate division TM6 bacterium GW2011_GWF2_43_87]|nr:MAG: hypothetical protein UW09_C0003G0087 [candidate division TM6 bacterium GW2011_GWF2_43_87]
MVLNDISDFVVENKMEIFLKNIANWILKLLR